MLTFQCRPLHEKWKCDLISPGWVYPLLSKGLTHHLRGFFLASCRQSDQMHFLENLKLVVTYCIFLSLKVSRICHLSWFNSNLEVFVSPFEPIATKGARSLPECTISMTLLMLAWLNHFYKMKNPNKCHCVSFTLWYAWQWLKLWIMFPVIFIWAECVYESSQTVTSISDTSKFTSRVSKVSLHPKFCDYDHKTVSSSPEKNTSVCNNTLSLSLLQRFSAEVGNRRRLIKL